MGKCWFEIVKTPKSALLFRSDGPGWSKRFVWLDAEFDVREMLRQITATMSLAGSPEDVLVSICPPEYRAQLEIGLNKVAAHNLLENCTAGEKGTCSQN